MDRIRALIEAEESGQDEDVDDMGDIMKKGEKKEEPKKKPPPTQFKEPEASSLLDAFGF
jgi:hypothetical protein